MQTDSLKDKTPTIGNILLAAVKFLAMEAIKLKCEKCGCDYEKPSVFKEYLVKTNYNVFYKWSLAFCDKCRREKERESLKAMPDVLSALGENLKT